VNFPDGLLVQGKYQLKPETPFIPGMEVAGEILKVGTDVSHFKIGDRVAALSQLSGYAEQAVVQEKSVFKIPEKCHLTIHALCYVHMALHITL
jgi:NADPH2:quinone reductase